MLYVILAILICIIFWVLSLRGTFTTIRLNQDIYVNEEFIETKKVYGARNGLGTWFYRNGKDSNKFNDEQCVFETIEELNEVIQSRKKTIF